MEEKKKNYSEKDLGDLTEIQNTPSTEDFPTEIVPLPKKTFVDSAKETATHVTQTVKTLSNIVIKGNEPVGHTPAAGGLVKPVDIREPKKAEKLSLFRKIYISLIIVLVLSAQVKANVSSSNSLISGSKLEQTFNQLSWVLGLSTRWRMFAPPPTTNWHYSIWAVYPDGEQTWLPLVNQEYRNFLQRNFFDFRETKFQLNIYNNPPALDLYSKHLCNELDKVGVKPQSIRFVLVSSEVRPPGKRPTHGPEKNFEFGVYSCPA